MVVYGKLKRKSRYQSDATLSPTKYSYKDEILTSSEPTSSFASNIFSSITSVETVDYIERDENFTPKALNLIDGKNVAFQPSSPVLTQNLNFGLDSAFKGFEELENLDYIPKKKQKTDLRQNNRIKTTFFSQKLDNSDNDSKQPNKGSSSSNDEFSKKISLTLSKLHNRIFELQNELLKNKNEESNDSIARVIGIIEEQKIKNYGSTRSVVMEEKSLSENESEKEQEDEDDDDEDGGKRLRDDIIHEHEILKCQSLNELRASGELETSKQDFEMILEQLEEWIDDSTKFYDLLLLKLDLIIKIKTNFKFRKYLQKFILGKFTSKFYKLLKKLLIKSLKFSLVNFQLILFFEVADIEINKSFSELIHSPKITLINYAINETKGQAKLLKEISQDWIDACEETEVFQIVNPLLRLVGWEKN